ncbi:MAG: SDR family oxidoreductase [Pseudomonadota bacterium]
MPTQGSFRYHMTMKKILVIGASSGIGLYVTRQALEKGHHVKAFARSAADIDINNPNLEKVRGDALSLNDVESALADCDTVVSALGVKLNTKLITGPITLFSEATRILIPLMQQKNIKRLICVTGFGAGESISAINSFQKIGFNMVFGRAYSDKSLQEKSIIDSQLDWTIVRPGVLLNCSKPESYKILANKDEWRNGIITRKNVADFIVNEITNNQYIHQAPVLVS